MSQSSWTTTGNANASPNSFIGTTTPVPLVMKTNGTERMTVEPNGVVKIAGLAATDTAALVVLPNGSLARSSDPGSGGTDCSLMLWDGNGNAASPNCFIGTTNPQPFCIYSNNMERMRVATNGNVVVNGFDAKAPFQVFDHLGITFNREDLNALDVKRSIGFNLYQVGSQQFHYQNGPVAKIEYASNSGVLNLSVAAAQQTNALATFPAGLGINKFGNVGIGEAPSPNETLLVSGTTKIQQPGNSANFLRIGHNGTNPYIESNSTGNGKLLVNMQGNRGTQFGGDVIAPRMAIGTTNFFDGQREFKLNINGDLRCKAAKIYPTWADYVFESNYTLRPLEEVAVFIRDNGHLPGIPDAATVAKEGIDIGEMQAKMLEKVEELTLYVLELKSENIALKNELVELKAGFENGGDGE